MTVETGQCPACNRYMKVLTPTNPTDINRLVSALGSYTCPYCRIGYVMSLSAACGVPLNEERI